MMPEGAYWPWLDVGGLIEEDEELGGASEPGLGETTIDCPNVPLEVGMLWLALFCGARDNVAAAPGGEVAEVLETGPEAEDELLAKSGESAPEEALEQVFAGRMKKEKHCRSH